MKIVYCIAGLYNSAGMERIITDKVNYFAEKDNDVYVITAEQKGRPVFFPLHQSVTHIDLGINYNDSIGICKLFRFWQKHKIHKQRLSEVLCGINADIVISTFGNEIFFLHQIKDGSKKIAEIHFCKNYRLKRNRQGIWKLIDWIQTKRENYIVKRYDKFVTLTEEDKLNWNGYSNVVCIPNFIYHIPNQVSQLKNKEIVAIGRLSYQKGMDHLINIWRIVSMKRPEWHLSIYGGGDLRDNLLSKISQFNLSDKITIHNPKKCLTDVYMNSSCYVMTSRYEGLPMVLLEAMSYGLPVVSFACPCGPRDLVENNYNGYLIEDYDYSEFSNRIIELIDSIHLRQQLGCNARYKALQYTKIVIMKRWEDLFRNMML